MREAFQAHREKQNVLSQQQCGANRRCAVVNIYPSAPTSRVKSNSIQGKSLGRLWFRQPLPSHSHQANLNQLCSIEHLLGLPAMIKNEFKGVKLETL